MSFGDARPYDPEEVYDPNAELVQADVGFTGPDIETDQNAIAETVFGRMADRVPGWQAHDGNPDTWLIENFAQVGAEIRALARSVPEAIFITFGSEVLGRPIRPPAPATVLSRWTAVDDLGYEIGPGTQVTVARTGDELVGFEVISGATIDRGELSVDGVELAAVINGAAGNGLTGPAEPADPLDWVESIELTETSENGDDGQDRDTYLSALRQLLTVMAFRPVLPPDFALLALQIPGFGRAVAMDGYDPRTDTWGHIRTVTLVSTGPDGLPLSDALKDQGKAALEATRELNWIVNVIDAHYETVNVSYEVTAFAEQDPEIVLPLCDDAVRQLLDPAQYRLGVTSPAIEAGEVIPPPAAGEEPGRRTVRLNDIIGRLDRCRGVDFVGEVLINGAAQDLVLGSPTTLPRPGEIDGTVNVPGVA